MQIKQMGTVAAWIAPGISQIEALALWKVVSKAVQRKPRWLLTFRGGPLVRLALGKPTAGVDSNAEKVVWQAADSCQTFQWGLLKA